MREPNEPSPTSHSGDTVTYFDAILFIGKSIMYGCYLIAEAIKLLRYR